MFWTEIIVHGHPQAQIPNLCCSTVVSQGYQPTKYAPGAPTWCPSPRHVCADQFDQIMLAGTWP